MFVCPVTLLYGTSEHLIVLHGTLYRQTSHFSKRPPFIIEDDGGYMYDDGFSIIHHLGCPDGSEDFYDTPPCKPPIFTVESCDLLTGWFTQAKEYCLSAQAGYDNYYDWDYMKDMMG